MPAPRPANRRKPAAARSRAATAAARVAAAAPAPSDAQFADAVAAFQSFNARTARWNPENALALAHAANLAYKDETTIRAILPRCGFPQVAVRAVREVQAFVAGGADAVLVSFRGTRPDQLLDWMTDLDAAQVPFGALLRCPDVGRTHQGFTRGLLRLWEGIQADVKAFQTRGQTLWITGHSLGGALAALAAAAWTFARREPVNGLYTFGQPRVGDLEFVRNFDAHLGNNTFRVVNNLDVVTRVPPRIFPHFPLPWFYGHAGQVAYFDGQGRLHSDETWWNEFLIRFDVGFENMARLLSGPIADHDLLRGYAANLARYRADLAAGRQGPLTW